MTGANAPQPVVKCGFFLHGMADMEDPERVFTLSPDDFKLFNPNTLTCPIFRRRRDAELTRKIYANVPILVKETPQGNVNPWGVTFLRMFDMANDSHLFETAKDLEEDGYWLGEGNVYTKGKMRYLPLYEGKMFQQFDHRAANIEVVEGNVHRPGQQEAISEVERNDLDFSALSRFWVPQDKVISSLRYGDKTRWQLGFKNVCSPTNVRSMIMTALPVCGAGHSIQFVTPDIAFGGKLWACFLANANAFPFDYAARQKIGGVNFSYFILEQLPIIPPTRYSDDWHGVTLADFITARVLELCYTAHDLQGFAADLGYTGPPFAWDEETRLHRRCQLDALYFHLYGLTGSEAGEILDTFPIVKRSDEARYGGKFRTRALILGYYSAYGAGNMDAWVKG